MAKIWRKEVNLLVLNEPGEHINTLLDIRFEMLGDDWITASMPVDARTHQPFGILHGGASVVLAESLGSTASYLCLDDQHRAVGLEVNANHLKAVHSGRVTARASAVHIGRTTHVWDIRLHDPAGDPCCIARLTMAVIPAR